MVQRMPSGDVVVKRVLNNLIGLRQAIIDCDNTLSQSLQQSNLKQFFGQFSSMDQKCMDDYQQVYQSIGGGSPSSPDQQAQGVINDCTQAIKNSNLSDIEKIGWYNLLLFSVNQGNNVLAQYGYSKGNENVSRMMSECYHMDSFRIEGINAEMVRAASQLG